MKAVPIKQGHKLTVSWPVTPSIHHYEEAPCMYLGHLIGHEAEGSLFHALKHFGRFGSLWSQTNECLKHRFYLKGGNKL